MAMKEEVKKLWKLCFNDSDEFIDMFFSLRYNNDTNIVIQKEGRLISALQMLPYPMTFQGIEIRTSYISGACTHPDFRGKGYMKQLLLNSFLRMVERKIPLSILIPAEPGLYAYYGRLGYASAFYRSRVSLDIPTTGVSGKDISFRCMTGFDKEVFAYFTKKARNFPNFVQHPEEDYKAILEDLSLSRGCVTVAYKKQGGEIAGALFAYPKGRTLEVIELFAENESVKEELLSEACSIYKCDHAVCLVPSERRTEDEAFGMIRIIDARYILQLYALSLTDQRMNIELIDKELSFNSGYYYLNESKVTFSTKKLAENHLTLTSRQLSKMVFDHIKPHMSLMPE